eukprot:gene15334-20316_t
MNPTFLLWLGAAMATFLGAATVCRAYVDIKGRQRDTDWFSIIADEWPSRRDALIAWLAIPSFIVTLGGLLVWRGAAWWVTQGQTIAPMDSRFRPLGGGIEGAIGTSASWAIGL